MRGFKKLRRAGFTLAELIVGMIIAVTVIFCSFAIAEIFILHKIKIENDIASYQISTIAFGVIGNVVDNAFLGATKAAKNAHVRQIFPSMNMPAGYNNTSLAYADGAKLELYYGAPSGVYIQSTDVNILSSGMSANVTLDSGVKADWVNAAPILGVKGWITFAASSLPLKISSIDATNRKIRVTNPHSADVRLLINDELIYPRLVRFSFAGNDGGNLYAEDITMGSGNQPQLESGAIPGGSFAVSGDAVSVTLLVKSSPTASVKTMKMSWKMRNAP